MADGLLLVHAWPTDARLWERQVDAFAVRLPVVAPNLPGFGGSDPAGQIMTMAAGAERCIAELDRAGIDRAVVCGLSLGGYVTFELWRRARERIAGLVLANTRAVADTPEAVTKRHATADRLRNEGIGFFLEDLPPLLSDEAPDDVRAAVRSLVADQPADSIAAALLGMAERPDSTPDLAGIDVPTLVITSDLDALVPEQASLDMASLIPGATTTVLEGVGHLSNLEAPDDFTELLVEHVEASGLGSGGSARP
jgi:3-oxoadipate enol-lactonase